MKEQITMDFYIRETPEVFQKNFENRKKLLEEIVNEFVRGGYENIDLIASGSSNNSARCAVPFMEKLLGIQIRVLTPFYFCHYVDTLPKDTLPLVISQSGYSTNAIRAARKLKEMGRPSIALTGDSDSDIKEECSLLIDYGMGVETVGYTTKGSVVLMEFLMLFAMESAAAQEKLGEDEYGRIAALFGKAGQAHRIVYEEARRFYEENKDSLNQMEKVYIMGSGANVGTAMEGALKISETVHCICSAYETEEYIHGPNIQVKKDYTLFFLDSFTDVRERIRQIREASRCFTPNVYGFSGVFISRKLGIETEDMGWFDLLSPLFNVVYFQYLSYKITEETGRWDDNGAEYDRFDALVHSKTETYEKMYQAGLVT